MTINVVSMHCANGGMARLNWPEWLD